MQLIYRSLVFTVLTILFSGCASLKKETLTGSLDFYSVEIYKHTSWRGEKKEFVVLRPFSRAEAPIPSTIMGEFIGNECELVTLNNPRVVSQPNNDPLIVKAVALLERARKEVR